MSVPTPAHDDHTGVTESTPPAPATVVPRIFAAELVHGLGVVLTTNEDIDLDTAARTRAAAAQAREFADWLDALASEQAAIDTVAAR